MLSEESRDRFRRHATEIVTLTVVCVVLGVVGVFPERQSVWLVPGMLLAGATVITLLYTRFGSSTDDRHVAVRAVVQTGVLTAISYATGWGFALPLLHLFAVADNVRHGGSRTVLRVTAAAAGWTIVAQTLLSFGLTPNIHTPTSDTWAIAAFMLLCVTGVAARVHGMAVMREAAEEALAVTLRRFQRLVEDSSDVVMVVRDGRITYASPALGRLLGHAPEAVLGGAYLDHVHPDDRQLVVTEVVRQLEDPELVGAIECRLRRADGGWVHVESRTRNLNHDDAIGGFVLNVRDVSERRELEAQLEHRAFHDPLTDLPNRSLFRDRVERAVVRSRRRGTGAAVLYIDLDGFKAINDRLGHAAGDEVLREVATRISRATRDTDTLARLGGDEFAMVLEELDGIDDAVEVAMRALAGLVPPVELETGPVDVGASIGVALCQAGWTAEQLTRNADAAMYAAKAAGKGTYAVFDPSLHLRVVERLKLVRELEEALLHDDLMLHYQPIVDLDDGRIIGVEALARWDHPDRGMVSPSEFIPLAEENGMIVELGRWALREALAQAARWRDGEDGDGVLVGMSINVSTTQLTDPRFVADVGRALAESGVDPASVTLEITESALLTDGQGAADVLLQLKHLGVRLAIDDFGTGYSNLSYLQHFPVDVLKIDRSFIEGMVTGTQSPALVRAIIDMGHSLDLRTVAEGIEHDEELSRVRTLSCNLGQGYLFGRPSPADEITSALRQPVRSVVESRAAARVAASALEHRIP